MKHHKYNEKLERQKQSLAEEKAVRPKRVIIGVQISEDHGKTWSHIAICTECFSSIEPPMRAVREIESGVRFCDWCGAENVK